LRAVSSAEAGAIGQMLLADDARQLVDELDRFDPAALRGATARPAAVVLTMAPRKPRAANAARRAGRVASPLATVVGATLR
jgi:hypothetical protein